MAWRAAPRRPHPPRSMIRAGVTLFRSGGRCHLANVTPAAILARYYGMTWTPPPASTARPNPDARTPGSPDRAHAGGSVAPTGDIVRRVTSSACPR
jgi:hypothetical protein